MLWARKSNPPPPPTGRPAGLDLTASRARGAAIVGGRGRPLVLDDPAEELPLFVALGGRTPDVGRAGAALIRKLPHTVCANFLPYLGQPREWRAGRVVLSPEAALAAAFDRLRPAVAAEADAVAVALPPYLTAAQAGVVGKLAAKARLPVVGSVSGPLAVAAAGATAVLAGRPADVLQVDAPGVVPLRRETGGPAAVVVVDADEHALSGTVVVAEPHAVRVQASAAWPRLGLKAWADRLVDAISDRCVRLCRRDPRDSADAEQALWEQLDAALDRSRRGQRVGLAVRTAHWYQDVAVGPDDLAAACGSLFRPAADGLWNLVTSADLPVPPRAVWLTDAAGRLPGLAAAVHAQSAEGTTVDVLAPGTVAAAAGALVGRWAAGELPRGHVDGVLGVPQTDGRPATEQVRTQGRR